MATEILQPQAVTTKLQYYLEANRGGSLYFCPGTVSDKRRPHDDHEATITNIRGREAEFTLDKQGFHVGPFETSVADVDDDAEFRGQYYQDVIAHVKKVTGATKVLPVTHIARRERWADVVAREKDLPDEAPVTAPTASFHVHVDQSYFGAELVRDSKLEEYAEADTEQLKKVHWAIINLWRPLNVVTRDALAICDARTVDESDLVALYADIPETLSKANTGYSFAAKTRAEGWEVRANPEKHKWYYAANMRPDEALLFTQYNSKTDGSARRTPHCAFSSEEDYGPTRLSVEVRCLVFWEDQPLE